MQTSIKKMPESQVEINFELSSDDFDEFVDKAISFFQKKIKIHGFRTGMAPKEMIINHAGQDVILKQAAEIAIQDVYYKEISQNKLTPISQPKIEILKLAMKNPFCFRASFFILPDINLPDYRKIVPQLKRKKVSVSEKEIQESIKWLQKSKSKLLKTNKGAQVGDWVEIEFSSLQIEKNKKHKDSFILGKGNFVPNFEDNLKGMKSGEKKNFSVKFPKDYKQKELKGKEVSFDVQMNNVSKMETPEINDDFVKSLGDFRNLSELKESISKGLMTEKNASESQRLRREILNNIVKESRFDVPKALIETEKQSILQDFKKKVSESYHLSFEDYLKKIKKTEQDLLKLFNKEAQERVKQYLVLKEIADKEKVIVTDKETEENVNKILERYPDIQKAKKEISIARLKSYAEEQTRNEKVFQFLEKFLEP